MNLKDVDFFSVLSDEDIEEIKPYFQSVTHSKKDMVFSEGDRSDWLYIVSTGKVKITRQSQDGKELILEIIQPNELFGAVAAFKGFPYPANAVAMESSTVFKIARKDLLKIIDRFPSVMFSIASMLGDRMRNSHDTLKNIALERVESRIASLLLKLALKSSPDALHIDFKLTKQDIADMAGTTVETSIRTISKFKRLGLISENKGLFVIKDLDGLGLFCH
ncbi:Crp/Fnr family transcriptional regulator [Candidatus Magnetominusculus xianensis]|uniref:Transcriptional regulator, Crp/Fnr family n=1 Tax=Candidatus Magnetominusculus xianensis TaxID=1748249 RepID=A0ABR5SGX1_9BACT|nr:Crp/Fnr family transcriptional regulator [Candidatus Magnetominusculus xianensis]KWT86733.1 putative transcriptional regulator, Crp/Fnr family [Candidatus Magnetominusculus xianensis]MBF0402548.1 Crp/Fnr family transcriptional regulator [Nitrospirota bacterium]